MYEFDVIICVWKFNFQKFSLKNILIGLALVYEIPTVDSWPQSNNDVWLRENGEGGN